MPGWEKGNKPQGKGSQQRRQCQHWLWAANRFLQSSSLKTSANQTFHLQVWLWFDWQSSDRRLPSALGGNGSSYKTFSANSQELPEKKGGDPTNKQKHRSQMEQTSLPGECKGRRAAVFLRKHPNSPNCVLVTVYAKPWVKFFSCKPQEARKGTKMAWWKSS